MGDHVAGRSTQEQHPWKATARTVVQVGVPALLTLGLVLPEVIAITLDGMGGHLPDGVRAWLLGAAAFVTALAGVLARVSAIPAVNRALERLGLDAPATAPVLSRADVAAGRAGGPDRLPPMP